MATLKIRNEDGTWTEIGGIRGKDGTTPNITVNATTLAAGSSATVTKTGTAENPVFTFGIPKGDKGDTGASSGVTSFNGSTGAVTYTAPVTSVNGQTGAVTVSTSDSTKIPLSGSRGTLAGYNTPASSSSAVTINASSNDDTIVTAAVAVTVSNGSSDQTWIKTVALQNASATVTLGSSWKWVGGSVPTITANSILVVKWCGTFGLVNLVAGE